MQATEPDCRDDAAECASFKQSPRTPGIWNPLPSFETVKADGELGNVQDLQQLLHGGEKRYASRTSCGSRPRNKYSEHPPALVSNGQAYVTG